jgi:Tfp pilus assembly protein PilF
MNENVLCNVCGDKNKVENNFCGNCGAPLKAKSRIKADAAEVLKKTRLENALKEKSQKKLSTKKLFYIVLGFAVLACVVVISSDVFENSVKDNSKHVAQQNNPHVGADMNVLAQIKDLETALQNKPGDKDTLLHLAHLLNDSDYKEKAVERYKEYLKLDTKNADVIVDMGVCYYDLGNNSEAISTMERAIHYQPKHQIANLNLGIVYMASGNTSQAKSYFQKAYEINPTNEVGIKAKELLNSH